jgi:hypothetical protein
MWEYSPPNQYYCIYLAKHEFPAKSYKDQGVRTCRSSYTECGSPDQCEYGQNQLIEVVISFGKHGESNEFLDPVTLNLGRKSPLNKRLGKSKFSGRLLLFTVTPWDFAAIIFDSTMTPSRTVCLSLVLHCWFQSPSWIDRCVTKGWSCYWNTVP